MRSWLISTFWAVYLFVKIFVLFKYSLESPSINSFRCSIIDFPIFYFRVNPMAFLDYTMPIQQFQKERCFNYYRKSIVNTRSNMFMLIHISWPQKETHRTCWHWNDPTLPSCSRESAASRCPQTQQNTWPIPLSLMPIRLILFWYYSGTEQFYSP